MLLRRMGGFTMNNKRLRMLNNELGLNDYAEAPNSQSIIEKVNNSINADPVERRLFMRRKFISSALVAALILSIASLTVIAATLGWHHKLIEYFNNPSAEQMELMNGAFDAPMVSGTDNGYTVNVLNTLADKHGIYVLYELVLPSNKEVNLLNVETYMQDVIRMLTVSERTQSNNAIMGMGVSSPKILGIKNNIITLVNYIGINGEIYDNQKLTLTVKHNKLVDDTDNTFVSGDKSRVQLQVPGNVKKVVKGDFDIVVSWDFQYKNIGKSFNIDNKLDINGVNNNILKNVDVSPISIWITVEGDDVLGALAPIIKFTDGTEFQYTNRDNSRNTYGMFANNQIGDNSKGVSSLGYVFDEITDIKTIESITIGDQIIKVN